MPNSIGPVMLDVIGTELTQEECDILQHPLVGGVIFFARNYESPEQIAQLSHAIRNVRKMPLLLAVDQEGGRVQRFRDPLTRLPSMGQIDSPRIAETVGWLMAAELLALGIDISFAPVLDLNKNNNTVIADRSFGRNPLDVIARAKALIAGMNQAGMVATGKHFPGHGTVTLDSHIAMPVDTRSFDEILQDDLQPFIALFSEMAAIMPAHIVFPAIDTEAVGFSKVWLQDILRNQFQYRGVIFSDDLNMAGAGVAGDIVQRSKAALNAGCDMILICNNRQAAITLLDQLPQTYSLTNEKYQQLKGTFSMNWAELRSSTIWCTHQTILQQWLDVTHSVT